MPKSLLLIMMLNFNKHMTNSQIMTRLYPSKGLH